MIYTCPKCGAIAEWNAYYGRYTCTRCTWEAKKTEIVSYQLRTIGVNGSLPLTIGAIRGKMKEEGHQ